MKKKMKNWLEKGEFVTYVNEMGEETVSYCTNGQMTIILSILGLILVAVVIAIAVL